MIKRVLRSYFLLKARVYKLTGLHNMMYYPPETIGHEGAKLMLAWGNLMQEISRAFK